MNLDLMKRVNELEKMMMKRQLSPSGEENGAPKRMRDNRRTEDYYRRPSDKDFEKFALDEEDDGFRNHQPTSRGRGRGTWTGCGKDNTYHQRTGKHKTTATGRP